MTKNIKSAVPTSKQPTKTKFVKKGTRIKNKNYLPSGILHQGPDCWLAPHIAFTELMPDRTTFSNSLKRVILVKLTCLCEQNMEARHNAKINKHMPLKSVIENNG